MYSTGRSLVRPRSRTTTLPASGWSSGANTATSAAGNPAASARAATAFAATVVPRACVELIAMSSLRMSRARDSNFCGGRGADVWPCAPIAALTAASASQRRDIDILLEFDSQYPHRADSARSVAKGRLIQLQLRPFAGYRSDYEPHSGSIPSLSLTARLSLCLHPRYRSVV